MGRTAPRKAKKTPPAAEPASSSTTATPRAARTTAEIEASLAKVLEGLHVGLANWFTTSATQEQRATLTRASDLVKDNPTPQDEAKASQILFGILREAGILGKLYPELADSPAEFLGMLASLTVQNNPEVLSGPDSRNGKEPIAAPSANNALAGAGSRPSGQPCSCSTCKGRQKFSTDDEPEGFFCAADLDLSQRDEITLAKAYNAQFSRRATKPPASVRKKLLEKARARRTDMGTASNMETSMCFFGLRKWFSSTPLHELSPIRIKEMEVPRVHRGRYLLCRIISRPVSGQCLSFVVEDQDGRAEHICIFNYPVEGLYTGDVLDELLPVGQALVIREPVFVKAMRGKSIVIRVDSPTDYALLPPSAALLDGAKWAYDMPKTEDSVEVLRLRGNEHMGEGSYELAAKAYSDALALEPTPEERLVLALNRAQAHLQADNHASCHRDASIVLAYLAQGVTGPPSAEKKARYRRASALHKLRRFERAAEEYTRVLEMDLDQDGALLGKAAVEIALKESRTGVYDWDRFDPDEIADVDDLTIGEFFGPVKVVDMPQRQGGRGVVATRDIQAGELLLVETPFAEGARMFDDQDAGFDLRTDTVIEDAKGELVWRLARMIVDDPKAASLVHMLYGGEAFPPTGKLSFDMRERDEPSLFPLPADVDIERLEAIVHLNALNTDEGNYDAYRVTDLTVLFLSASAFNHSCEANALRRITERYVTIRARRPIKAGEEVTVPYIASDAPRRLFDEIMKTHFGKAGCPCPECVAERAEDPDLKQYRKELVAEEYAAMQATVSQPATFSRRAALRSRMRLMLDKLEASYGSSNRTIRQTLAQQYSVYAYATETKSPADYKILVDYELKALRCLGADFNVGPTKVDIVALPLPNGGEKLHLRFLYLARDCVLCGISQFEREVRKWTRAAWLGTNMEFGWSWEYFIEREERTLEECNLWRFVASWKPS